MSHGAATGRPSRVTIRFCCSDGSARPAAAHSPPPFRHGSEQLHYGRGRGMATVRILHRRRKLLGQPLAEFNAPLIERIDAPDDALREHTVLVERDELPQGCRVELLD